MKQLLNKVTEFHLLVGAPVSAKPRLLKCHSKIATQLAAILRDAHREITKIPSPPDLVSRMGLALEELCEWAESHEKQDLIAAADALGDRLYVLLGDSVATGLPVEKIFYEVHQSNMTKSRPEKGGHKGIKTSQFSEPQLANLVTEGN